jgi:hypothetical protein
MRFLSDVAAERYSWVLLRDDRGGITVLTRMRVGMKADDLFETATRDGFRATYKTAKMAAPMKAGQASALLANFKSTIKEGKFFPLYLVDV